MSAPIVDSLITDALIQARALTGIEEDARIVVSPYRFNPLGAHIDHQGGATVATFANHIPLTHGITAVVIGTLVSGGLSSSASVILAYLSALAEVNGVSLSPTDLVELSRQVENDYRGLNNGIQDQMSISGIAGFGSSCHCRIRKHSKNRQSRPQDPEQQSS